MDLKIICRNAYERIRIGAAISHPITATLRMWCFVWKDNGQGWLLLQWFLGLPMQTLNFVSTPRQYPFQKGR